MARFARVVVPGYPHHLIQRGNRRQRVFFSDEDRAFYLILLKRQIEKFGIALWAFCLMENHVHLVAVPRGKDGFARAIGELHRKYTSVINTREDWKGYLWQGRFITYPLSEAHLIAAVRYVERNPVRAGLVQAAEDYDGRAPARISKKRPIRFSRRAPWKASSRTGRLISGKGTARRTSRSSCGTGKPAGRSVTRFFSGDSKS